MPSIIKKAVLAVEAKILINGCSCCRQDIKNKGKQSSVGVKYSKSYRECWIWLFELQNLGLFNFIMKISLLILLITHNFIKSWGKHENKNNWCSSKYYVRKQK